MQFWFATISVQCPATSPNTQWLMPIGIKSIPDCAFYFMNLLLLSLCNDYSLLFLLPRMSNTSISQLCLYYIQYTTTPPPPPCPPSHVCPNNICQANSKQYYSQNFRYIPHISATTKCSCSFSKSCWVLWLLYSILNSQHPSYSYS